MTDALNEARRLIETRLREVRGELAHLERVLRDLAVGTDGQGRRRPRRSAAPSRSGRRKTATREQRMNSLVAEARKAPTATNAALAKALGVTPSYTSQLLAEGRKTGRIARRNGKLVVGRASGTNAGTKRRQKATSRSRRASKRAQGASPRRRKASAPG